MLHTAGKMNDSLAGLRPRVFNVAEVGLFYQHCFTLQYKFWTMNKASAIMFMTNYAPPHFKIEILSPILQIQLKQRALESTVQGNRR